MLIPTTVIPYGDAGRAKTINDLVRQVAETVSETFRFRGEILDRYPRGFAAE